jgi:prevent-host-death family protein
MMEVNLMERKMTATAARVHFGEVMRRVVEQGEQIIVERAGRPQVVILSVDAYERMKTAQRREDWHEVLARAVQVGARVRARREGRPLTPPDEIIRQMREERDAQFDSLR